MRVLIYKVESELAPVGGPLGYCFNIKEELKRRGITDIDFLPDIPKDNLKSNSIKKYFSTFKKLVSGKQTNFDFTKYDAIHFHSVKDFYQNRIALKNYKGKILFTMHSPVPFHMESNENIKKHHKFLGLFLNKHAFSYMDKYVFDHADYIVLPCVEAEESYYFHWKAYKKIHERNKEKYRYIPTGIVGAKAKIDADEYRNSLGYSKDDFIVAYVGRHNEIKGYDRIINMAKKLNNENIKFLVGGKEFPLKGPELSNWKEIGWTNDPYSLVNSANVFILPNRETYFDIVMLETLSLGKNSLISNTGGNKVIISKNVEGIYSFDNDDEGAQIISDLYEKKISYLPNKDIVKLFKENYSIEIFVTNYLGLLNSVINNEENK